MPKRTFARRPTKGMMLAVDAAIEGDKATVDQLLKEYDLDYAEIEHRLGRRNGRKYSLSGQKKKRKTTAPRSNEAVRSMLPELDFKVTLDGRTSVAKLFKLIEYAERLKSQAQQELKRRSPEEIEPVKKALSEIELLRREREKIEQKLRTAEEALA